MSWTAALNSHWPEVLLFLAEMTVLLIAGLIAQMIATRSTAIRHAILLGTLMAIAILPLLTAIVDFYGLTAPLPIRHSASLFSTLFANSDLTQPVLSGVHAPAAKHWFLKEMLAVVWLLGIFWQSVRMIVGMFVASRQTRDRKSMAPGLVPPELHLNMLGQKAPLIFLSDAIAVPMAVGYFHPVIVLPSALIESLSERQLSQVLVHESAHVRRRDALAALFQEILKSIFWFHPLVHVASWQLDNVREEICDNYVLQTVAAKEYAHTLLSIAELIPKPAGRQFAPALIQSGGLDKRVAGLLSSRRCTMIRLTPKKVAAIALSFLGSVVVLSCCFAGSLRQDSSQDFSHVVRLERRAGPDSITVDEVRGPVDALVPGNTYEVRGSYKLASQDKALLAVYVTREISDPPDTHPDEPSQRMIVEKGEGTFVLHFHMWHKGNPHVTFYPAKGGNSFLSTYF